MRIIGLDWGEARIGVAVSDPLGLTALPLDHLKNDNNVMPNIKKIIQKYNAEEIVVGRPINMNGSKSASTIKAEEFQDFLSKGLDIKVSLWDERFTSKIAEKALIESGFSRSSRKDLIDSSAASIMLQGYMENKKNAPRL
jgi:putative Holliday junction resolvase